MQDCSILPAYSLISAEFVVCRGHSNEGKYTIQFSRWSFGGFRVAEWQSDDPLNWDIIYKSNSHSRSVRFGTLIHNMIYFVSIQENLAYIVYNWVVKPITSNWSFVGHVTVLVILRFVIHSYVFQVEPASSVWASPSTYLYSQDLYSQDSVMADCPRSIRVTTWKKLPLY